MEREPKPHREVTEEVEKRIEKIAENHVLNALSSLKGVAYGKKELDEAVIITKQNLREKYASGEEIFEPAKIPHLKWNGQKWELEWPEEQDGRWHTKPLP